MSRIRDAQKLLIVKHGVDRYPTIPEKLSKLLEEAGELAGAYNKNKPISAIKKELADIVLTAQNIASYYGLDVEDLVIETVANDGRDFSNVSISFM